MSQPVAKRPSENRWEVARLERRRFVAGSAAAIGATLLGGWQGAWARQLMPTPRQTEGPFYPLTLPLDSDNDLARVEGRTGRPAGQLVHVMGRILDADGRPIAGARVEIWQCNAFGRYLHPRDTRDAPLDPNFQGYGQTTTGSDGGYRFRTIKPVPYSFRAPHIHFAVSAPGAERLVTQMYVAGEPRNQRDGPLNRIGDASLRNSLIVDLKPAPAIEPDSLSGIFDIVLGAGRRSGRG